MAEGSTKLCSEPHSTPCLEPCTTSGADLETVEEDHTDGAREVAMTIYGRWGYVKHNEQNINTCDKVTGW